MNKALITFANGKTLEVHEGQLLQPIVKYQTDKEFNVSLGESKEIWYHVHDGLIPSLTEFLCNCEFFCFIDKRDKIYKSSAIVSIENI